MSFSLDLSVDSGKASLYINAGSAKVLILFQKAWVQLFSLYQEIERGIMCSMFEGFSRFILLCGYAWKLVILHYLPVAPFYKFLLSGQLVSIYIFLRE